MRPRGRPAPPPDPAGLADRPLHEVVRDHPETLHPLRSLGVDVGARGGDAVGEVVRAVPGLEDAVRSATAWRGRTGSGSSPGVAS